MAAKDKSSKGSDYPSMMAYTASLSPTDALFFGADSEGNIIAPVSVESHTLLGSLSDFSKAKDANSQDAVMKANIQRIDRASLPAGADHLLVRFSLKALGHAMSPYTCNSPKYRSGLEDLAGDFAEKGGFAELARLYAGRIMSGKWLWRNGESVSIRVTATVRVPGEETAVITHYPLEDGDSSFPALSKALEAAFTRQCPLAVIKVEALVEMHDFAVVYPSQEFLDKDQLKTANRSKVLYSVSGVNGIRQAAMHSQKIGNSLRTIDGWHRANDRVIAVEPFGIDKHHATAYRTKGNSLYDHLQSLPDLKASLHMNGVTEDLLYVFACLVRGGVYGGKAA